MSWDKCIKHGIRFCCRCDYGDINKKMNQKEEMKRDSVTDLDMPDGYKLHAWQDWRQDE